MKCIYCGKETETENIIHGDYVCSECLENYFTRCYDCGAWVHNNNSHAVINREDREVVVWEYCCDNLYTFCPECEAFVRSEEGTDRTFDEQWRCYECLDNSFHFVYCESCETYYRVGDMTYSESRQTWLCPEEAEEDDTVI